MTHDTRWCNKCERWTQHSQDGVNHLLHVVLMFLTGGVWFFVWVVLVVLNQYRQAYCCECHTPYTRPRRTLAYAHARQRGA